MSTANQPQNVTEYLRTAANVDPKTLLEIAVLETEKAKANAAKAAEEYRAMAEVEFDGQGRITKANMAGLFRLATIYANAGEIVPAHYKGNREACFIACQMAFRLKIEPIAYMQNSYIVHGKPGLEAKLGIALMNMSGKIKGRIKYREEGEGKSRAVTAWAIDADSGEEVSATVDWTMVEAEGWASKSGSKWKTIPQQMFRYRSAVFLIRAFYPEVLMGIEFADELQDIGPAQNGGEAGGNRISNLNDLTDHINRMGGVGNGSSGNGHSATNGNGANGHATEAAGETGTDSNDDGDYDEQGEHRDNHHGEVSGETGGNPDAEALQDELQEAFGQATDLTTVGKIEAAALSSGLVPEATVKMLAETARNRVKAGRGGNAKSKQGQLVN